MKLKLDVLALVLLGASVVSCASTHRSVASSGRGMAVPALNRCPFDELDPSWQQELLIYHFYVGQGDSTFVRTPSGTTVLIDAGLPGQGRVTILPVFAACKIDHLDYGVVTHPHSDHFGGWMDLFNAKLKVGTFYYPLAADEDGTPGASAWASLKVLAQKSVDSDLSASDLKAGRSHFQIPDLGKTSIVDGGAEVSFNIIARGCATSQGLVQDCFKNPQRTQLKDNNAASIAQIIRYKNFAYWAGGDLTSAGYAQKTGNPDIEGPAAASLREQIQKIDVYHVNHHGSDTSSSDALLEVLNPDYAVISAGIGGINGNNSKAGQPGDSNTAFHLPDEGTVLRLAQHGVKEIFLTSLGETEGKDSSGNAVAINVADDPKIQSQYPNLKVFDNQENDILLVSDGNSFSFHGAKISDTGPHPASSR